jgi:hypothetical protein
VATFLLDGAESARLPRRPLSVTLSVGGRHRGGARLTARGASGLDPAVRTHSATMLIVPRVDQEIVLIAVPDTASGHFDDDTVLHVTIGPDTYQDPDADYVQLAPREVSGLGSIELASIAPAGLEQVAVTTRLTVKDTPLPPLANRARVACRGALGVDSLPAGRAVSLGCVIDASTSMAALAEDGTLAAATDIVAGVAAVIAGSQPPRAVLADIGATDIGFGPAGELGSRVREAIGRAGYGVGANLDGAVDRIANAVGLTVVITDAARRRTDPAPLGPVSWMVLSESARRYPGFTGAVLPPAPLGVPAETFYDANPHLIDTAVAALVAPIRRREMP